MSDRTGLAAALSFPTAAERRVRRALQEALAEHAWVAVVFRWKAAEVPENAKRSGALMRFNIRAPVDLGPHELATTLSFGGVAHAVSVPYFSILLLLDAQTGELLARFDEGEAAS